MQVARCSGGGRGRRHPWLISPCPLNSRLLLQKSKSVHTTTCLAHRCPYNASACTTVLDLSWTGMTHRVPRAPPALTQRAAAPAPWPRPLPALQRIPAVRYIPLPPPPVHMTCQDRVPCPCLATRRWKRLIDYRRKRRQLCLGCCRTCRQVGGGAARCELAC